MMHDKLQDLLNHGQSLWYDNISRDLLESGEIKQLVDSGIRGLTSNPAIFKKAITTGTTYDDQLRDLIAQGLPRERIYELLAIADIQAAADVLRPVYDESNGEDGYVSLEVSPFLAADTKGTINELRRLWQEVDRPNLMIKIPGTEEGLPAIEQAIADGVNVNITLLFSRDAYNKVMQAYIKGLERRKEAGESLGMVASVASFFISRVDSLVDGLLNDMLSSGAGDPETLKWLQGKVGIANAKLAYQSFKAQFESERFEALREAGAQIQRPLWASTSTKNPDYSDVLYVETLIGPMTVNTAPPKTIDAFLDHGSVASTLEENIDDANRVMETLENVGIDIDAVTDQLLSEAIEKFQRPFTDLLEAIEAKSEELTTASAD